MSFPKETELNFDINNFQRIPEKISFIQQLLIVTTISKIMINLSQRNSFLITFFYSQFILFEELLTNHIEYFPVVT